MLGHAARRGSLVLCLAVSLASWSEVAHADDEAVARFERGVQLYEGENYEGALVEFTTAYNLSKNYKLLYNIGICQTALKEYVLATETFQHYLTEGGAEVPDAKKADVNDRLAKLALNVAHVHVVTDAPAGTLLLVDDQQVATVPLPESIPVKIGRRQFSLTVDGRRATQTVAVASSSERATVTLNVAEAAPPVVDVGAPRPAPVAGPSFPYLWWGLTAGLGAAAAITGTIAVGKRNDFEDQQASFGIDKKSLEDSRSSARTFGIVTDALLVATVVGGGLSTWFTIDYLRKKKQKNTGLYVTPTGVGYAGSF